MAENESEERGMTPTFPMGGFADFWSDRDRVWGRRRGWRRLRPLFSEPAWPSIDVFDKDGALVVKADVPGMKPEDIEVHVTEDGLTISGERSAEKEVKEKDFYRSERTYGRFMRQIPLPAGADRDAIDASFKDGVLEVKIPLKEASKQKKIEVKAS